MPFVPRAIHQFHAGSAVGDGITNGMLYTRGLLRSLGFDSEIFCDSIVTELSHELHQRESFVDHSDSVLLLHHSMGHDQGDWITGLKCRKILVYHNITPAEFFPPGSAEARYSALGRQQLAKWRDRFDAAIGDSPFNTDELLALGYQRAETIPLLFDPQDWLKSPYDRALALRLAEDDAFNILFVGRIVANKCQEDLILAIDRLRHMMDRPVRLILAGGISSVQYQDRLTALCRERGLTGVVEFAGKVPDAQLLALYRGADAFLCLSEHEGFGIPLIEAMQFDLPVIAYASSNVTETVGNGGLLLEGKDHDHVAATLKLVAEQPELRRRMVRAGRDNLQRYEKPRILKQLARFLRQHLAIETPLPLSGDAGPANPAWRLEGPFDSSYSLALVNRSLALALDEQGVNIGLHPTEGPGDYEPDKAYLAARPRLQAIWQRGRAMMRPDVVLRDLYPPRVSAMAGHTRVLSDYGWEESAIPPGYVNAFNRELNLITTLSRYVAKTLVQNGVRVPTAVVGAGIEQLREAKPVAPRWSLGHGPFRFLHVSSCFPRKGVDILLKAWSEAFSRADGVTLVIKTFPNPHNDIAARLAALARSHPDHAEIVLIDEDVDDGAMAGLYEACDALVLPSRGEGFGVPVIEAMAFAKPVIATAHGGLVDFCNAETAWLVDYSFAYAQTHIGVFDSVWAEPRTESLVAALRAVRFATQIERQPRLATARRLVERHFTWAAAARRTRQAIAALDQAPAIVIAPKIAWVSTWNKRCGIASYSRDLSREFPANALAVFAARSNELLAADEPYVTRCWNEGWGDSLDELHDAILASGARHAVLQFNFGFFEITAFGRLLDRLRSADIACFVMFHSTQDVIRPERQISLRQIRDSLSAAAGLLVHAVSDLNLLKEFGLVENVMLFPQGVAVASRSDTAAIRREFKLGTRRVIASFGYLLPHKGTRQLIEAFFDLAAKRDDLHLLLANSLYPVEISQREAAHCRDMIARHSLGKRVTLITDYLAEDRAHALLQAADLIVYPYQQTQESSSAAVRFGLASGRPVACTPLPIFEDIAPVAINLPGMGAAELAAGIAQALDQPQLLAGLAQRQADWLACHDWSVLSRRLWHILTAPPVRDLVAEDIAADNLASEAVQAQ